MGQNDITMPSLELYAPKLNSIYYFVNVLHIKFCKILSNKCRDEHIINNKNKANQDSNIPNCNICMQIKSVI